MEQRWLMGGRLDRVKNQALQQGFMRVEMWFGGYMDFTEVLTKKYFSSLVGTRIYSVLDPIDWHSLP